MPDLQRITRAVDRRLTTYRMRRIPSGPVPLPPQELRMGGHHFMDDGDFRRSARKDVARLIDLTGLTHTSRLLDWGSGAGRLAVGVAEVFGRLPLYRGIDVQKPLIDWAQANLGTRPGFEFVHADIANQRYNPDGTQQRRIDAEDSQFDVIYAYSVFSHMLSPEVDAYLPELRRVLSPGGKAWFTAFVEDDVPPEVENPAGYGPFEWAGPLHCVRFDRTFFTDKISRAGLAIDHFVHGQETDGQSAFVVSRASGSRSLSDLSADRPL